MLLLTFGMLLLSAGLLPPGELAKAKEMHTKHLDAATEVTQTEKEKEKQTRPILLLFLYPYVPTTQCPELTSRRLRTLRSKPRRMATSVPRRYAPTRLLRAVRY